jgi:hypothetical protein
MAAGEKVLNTSGSRNAIDALNQLLAQKQEFQGLINGFGFRFRAKQIPHAIQLGLIDVYVLPANLPGQVSPFRPRGLWHRVCPDLDLYVSRARPSPADASKADVVERISSRNTGSAAACA